MTEKFYDQKQENSENDISQIIANKILPYVEKPVYYIGNEYNIIVKDWQTTSCKTAFLFPDTYEIGMSHLGLRVLYQVVNNIDGALLERAFAPRNDMEAKLKEYNIPLYSLENQKPIKNFDFVAFTLQYELSYSNILNMLDLAQIPLLAAERKDFPIVIAGGPCAFNPEPLADFIDLFMIGEGEECWPKLIELFNKNKANNGSKNDFLLAAAQLPGIYIPSFYKVKYKQDNKIESINAKNNAPAKVKKNVIKNFDQVNYPTKALVPYGDIVHNRMMLEIMRGCGRGCRFCQAGIIYRPVREKKQSTLTCQAMELVKNTGYEEIGLVSLSSADYSNLEPLTKELLEKFAESGIGISLPSLRADAFSVEMAHQVQKVRKSTLTFAPEAGSQRLRDIINKGITDQDIYTAAKAAFSKGWTNIKLYFMIGLPEETDDDLVGIVDLAKNIMKIGNQNKPNYIRRPITITVSVSNFVPKPHTPFQWFPQNNIKELKRKQMLLKDLLKRVKGVKYSYHDAETSFLEAVFAKGDRRLGKVLLKAWEKGCKFDGWAEFFSYQKWLEAFEETNIDPDFYAYGKLEQTDILPWDTIDSGISNKWLWQEWQKAKLGKLTQDCRQGQCNGCGICPNFNIDLELEGKSQNE